VSLRIPSLAALALLACARRAAPADATPAPDGLVSVPDAAPPACDRAGAHALAPGLTVEWIATNLASPAGLGDGCLTLVRADPARYRLRVLAAARDGGRRTAPDWAAAFGLAAVTNSSMFDERDRSIGLLVADGVDVGAPRDNRRLGGFLAFDPVAADAPPVVIAGRDCPGFDLAALRAAYRSIVQDYRLLDCAGGPVAWQDPKVFSAAALGLDADGRVVFLHSRTPYRMADLSRVLAGLHLRGALYLEGGPEASLYVRAGATTIAEIGSFETAFFDGSNSAFWEIPNVVALEPR
jgi:hypothetical protein